MTTTGLSETYTLTQLGGVWLNIAQCLGKKISPFAIFDNVVV